MKRRSFLKRTIPAATVLPGLIGGYSVKAFPGTSLLMQALNEAQVGNDRVLVIVQLNGGNDGLNMVIPIDSYSAYYNARTNIAIPETKILKLNGYDHAGLHPSMSGMQRLYNDGKLALVQSVGYPSPNFSHFRATDIWMSASDSNVEVGTGWAGRFLATDHPNFPTGYPTAASPDPLAIQIGSVTSLTFQGPTANMGMSITDPSSFYNLINGVTDPAPANNMGNELSYIRRVAQQTNQYTQRIKEAATSVTAQAAYPSNNSLADQLKIVARLIRGGLKTKLYMVNYGSFDTHSLQANALDTTTGTHATLLGNVSAAIKAFMDDAAYLGIEDKVMGMSFSEFGRRIKSNFSGGTDHGAAAPLFVFGKSVVGGVTGTNPVIPPSASVNDNIPFQYDFRSVYASVLENWFCVNNTDLQSILFRNFQSINIVNSSGCKGVPAGDQGDNLISNYPNPFVQSTTIKFTTKGGHTLVQVIDMSGRVVATPVDKEFTTAGTYTTTFNSGALAQGVYYARLQNGPTQQVKAMLKVRE